VAIEDVLEVIQHTSSAGWVCGLINVVSPNAVTNREFTKTLGCVLGRPTVFPMPALVARVIFGEMAVALLLGNARVQPIRLEGSGYRLRFPALETSLRRLVFK
jgi:NAD dependent epimerase/dehydratase family enzyme